LKSTSRPRTLKSARERGKLARGTQSPPRKDAQLDPRFLEAARASKKKFSALFKRLAKT